MNENTNALNFTSFIGKHAFGCQKIDMNGLNFTCHHSTFRVLSFIQRLFCHYFQLEQFLFSHCMCAVAASCICFKVKNFFVIITLRASWWRKQCAAHTVPVVYRVSMWYDLFFLLPFEFAQWFDNLFHFHLKWQTFQFQSASQCARHIGTWTECSCWKSIWVLCSLNAWCRWKNIVVVCQKKTTCKTERIYVNLCILTCN